MALKRNNLNRDLRNSGFTLVELLVVLGVILILASILLPALSRAKAQAAKIICINSHKQLILGWHLYSDDHNGRLAPNNLLNDHGDSLGTKSSAPCWVAGTVQYETVPGGWPLPPTTNLANLTGYTFGSLGPYVKRQELYKCPMDKSYVMINDRKVPRIRSYAMSSRIGGPEGKEDRWITYRTMSSIDTPSFRFVFIDEHEDSIDDGHFLLAMVFAYPVTIFKNLPASRHSRGTPISYADGSVSYKAWQNPGTRKPVTRQLFQGSNFIGNEDVIWLQARTTVLKDSF